jgi:hypothetical protein
VFRPRQKRSGSAARHCTESCGVWTSIALTNDLFDALSQFCDTRARDQDWTD